MVRFTKISKEPKVQGAASFAKSIALLQMIAENDEPNMAALLDISGLKRPTLHRMLKALEAENLVEVTPQKTFKVGTRLLQFAGRALEQNDISRLARGELERLCQITKETVHLAIRSGYDMVYIAKKDSPMAVRIASAVGGRVPLHASALGKSVLAHLPKKEQVHVLDQMEMNRITPFTITDRQELESQIEKIQQDKYASAHQETDIDIQCFGAPIFDKDRQPVAALSISVPIFRLNKDFSFYVKPLLETCSKITKQLNLQS